MIYTITLNPCVDRTVTVDTLVRGNLNRTTSSRMDPAGKAVNVSRVLKILGMDSVPIACLAGNAGRFISQAIGDAGLSPHAVWLEGETRTNLKIMEPGGILTEINEPGTVLTGEALASILGFLDGKLVQGDWLIASGSLPPGAPKPIYGDFAKLAMSRGAKSLIDADGPQMMLALDAPPWMIKPNLFELSGLVGVDLSSHDPGGVVDAAMQLIRKGVELAVVSMGAEGALFVTKGESWRAWTDPIEVGSPVGCGDTLAAAVVWGLETGLSLQLTAKMAVAAAAAKAMKPGTELPAREEMQAVMGISHVEGLDGRVGHDE